MGISARFSSVMKFLVRAATTVVALGVLVIVIAWLAGAFGEKIPPGRVAQAPRQLHGQPTEEVHEITKQVILEAVGTLKAASRTVVAAKVLATIEEMTVAAGDQVAANQLLVRLSSEQLAAQLRQAEEALVAAQATRKEAETSHQRLVAVQEKSPGTITQTTFDQSFARMQVARAEVSRLQQAVTEANVLLGYTEILAPKAGRVVDRLAEPGDTVTPGSPLLVLYDAQSLRLEAPVSEHLAVQLQVGEKLEVHIDALDRTLEATVDEIVPQAAAASRSFLVKVALPASPDLYEGLFGRLFIPAASREHLCLSTAAIERIGQLEFVDVVRGDGSLERRLVKSGRLGMPGRVEVLSGLNAGDRVVLHGDAGGHTAPKEPGGDE